MSFRVPKTLIPEPRFGISIRKYRKGALKRKFCWVICTEDACSKRSLFPRMYIRNNWGSNRFYGNFDTAHRSPLSKHFHILYRRFWTRELKFNSLLNSSATCTWNIGEPYEPKFDFRHRSFFYRATLLSWKFPSVYIGIPTSAARSSATECRENGISKE